VHAAWLSSPASSGATEHRPALPAGRRFYADASHSSLPSSSCRLVGAPSAPLRGRCSLIGCRLRRTREASLPRQTQTRSRRVASASDLLRPRVLSLTNRLALTDWTVDKDVMESGELSVSRLQLFWLTLPPTAVVEGGRLELEIMKKASEDCNIATSMNVIRCSSVACRRFQESIK
jgi:hypothetical protein